MRIIISFIFFLFISANSLTAKNLGVSVSYASFLDDNNEPYVELYFAIAGKSLMFNKIAPNEYQGSLQVLVTLSNAGSTMGYSKFNIKTEALRDTHLVAPILLHQERLRASSGKQILFIELVDGADTNQAYPIEQSIVIDFKPTACSSDLLVLERYETASTPNSFTKSGYNLYPIISNGIAIIPKNVNELRFYTELYHTLTSFGNTGNYAYRYYLKDATTGNKLSRYGRTVRATAQKVQPIIGIINVQELPTGQYELVLEIIDTKGIIVFKKNTIFYRKAFTQPLSVILDRASNNPQNFAKALKNADTLYNYIEYLSPVSSNEELLMQQEVLERADLEEMQNYLFGFWEEKFPTKAADIWKRYLSLANYANKEFTSTLQPGYLTDRGSTYLLYGAPDQMEDRKMEPTLPPYQIWQYQTVNSPFAAKQTNKVFVFAEFQHPSNDYELIHSTAIGELYNARWRYQLANGKLGSGDLDENNPDLGDEMGSRLNNNTLIMPSEN